ncbi:MAG: hypothetical protein GY754_33135 [bacterium]|nr:hypothetical protein [bacterium]
MDKSIEDAMRFISGEIQANPDADKMKIINEASQKYDLNPMQTQFFTNKFVLNK